MAEERLGVPLLGLLALSEPSCPTLSCKEYYLIYLKARVAFGVSSTQNSRSLWSWGLYLCPLHSRMPARLCQQVTEMRATEIGRICEMEPRCGLVRAGEGLSSNWAASGSRFSPPRPSRLQMVPDPKDLLTRGSRLRWELGGLGPRLGPLGIKQGQDPLCPGAWRQRSRLRVEMGEVGGGRWRRR